MFDVAGSHELCVEPASTYRRTSLLWKLKGRRVTLGYSDAV